MKEHERWRQRKEREIDILERALTLLIWDRDHTESIVGAYMDGNNWANWGNFVAAVDAYAALLAEED